MVRVISTPSSLIATQLGELVTHLPGVRTADVEAVHDARVLTRRLRELLRLAPNRSTDVVTDATDRLKAAGRALGEVRELDVLDSLLDGLQPRARFAAATLSDFGQELRQIRRDARRRMFKTIEGLDLGALESDRVFRRAMAGVDIRPSHLRRHIGRRSEAVRGELRRAAGVYMPNRSHRARIAIKKLRYAVEVAEETGVWQPKDLLKDLHRAQSLLGEMHDRQVLVDRLKSQSSDHGEHPQEAGWLIDLMGAEIEELHQKFLRRVPSLESAAAMCERWATPRPMPWNQRLGGVVRFVATSTVLVASIHRAVDRLHAAAERRRPFHVPSDDSGRQRDGEDSPTLRAICSGSRTTMQLDEVPDDRQSQPGAARSPA
jgi:CHAD domain-containing protein